MLKKLLIVAIVLMLLGVAVLVLALFNINSLVSLYKPELERIATETLGTSVELGELNTSIFPAAKIKAQTVKIGANKSQAHSLAVGSLTLELQLRPLLSNELKVDTLTIDSPSITLINSAGGMQLAGLTQKPQANSSAPTTTPNSQSSHSEPLKISLAGVSVRNGIVRIVDDREESASFINRIAFKDLSLDSSVELSGSEIKIPKLDLSAKLLDKHAVTLKAAGVGVDSISGAIKVPDGALTVFGQPFQFSANINSKTSSGDINASVKSFDLTKLAELADVLTALKELRPTGSLDSKLELRLVDSKNFKLKAAISLDKVGFFHLKHTLQALSGNVDAALDPNAVNVQFKDITLQVDQSPVTLQGALVYQRQSNTASVKLDSVKIFGGEVSSDTKLEFAKEMFFSGNINASGLSIAQLLAFVAPKQSARLNGTLDNLTADLSGPLDADLAHSASGRVRLSISKGALLGVNLAAKVLSEVKSIPLIAGALSAHVPAAYQSTLNSPDTPIRRLTATFALRNGSLLTKDLHIESDIFSIDIDGTFTVESDLNLNTTIFFTKEFSQALATSIPPLKKVLAADGRLTFPLAIHGRPDALVIMPNLNKLIELAGKRVLKDGADQLLDQALKKTPGGDTAKKALEGLLGF